MVQVDIFWAYAFGAGYAMAAHRQLKQEHDVDPDKARENQWYSRPFVKALLFISILFAPSGIYLLWAFPDWETMQVAASHGSIPAWLVTLFAITNITQGILGYWTTRKLIVGGSLKSALLNFQLGYLGFFFILVHGWDGTGYQRFFSASRDQFLTWGERPWYAWLTSDVAFTLYGMGLILLPVVLFQCARLYLAGAEKRMPTAFVVAAFLLAVFGGGLLPAILASLSIHALGWIGGTLVFALAYYALFVRGAYKLFLQFLNEGRLGKKTEASTPASL